MSWNFRASSTNRGRGELPGELLSHHGKEVTPRGFISRPKPVHEIPPPVPSKKPRLTPESSLEITGEPCQRHLDTSWLFP